MVECETGDLNCGGKFYPFYYGRVFHCEDCHMGRLFAHGLLRGDVMPFGVSPERQREIDAVTLDFNPNRDALVRSGAAFVKQLLAMTPPVLRERTAQTYDGKAEQTPHLLAYHQAMHLMTHCGQIRSIRNLYRRTRGERARFHPENPTYPGGRPDARRDEDAGPAIP